MEIVLKGVKVGKSGYGQGWVNPNPPFSTECNFCLLVYRYIVQHRVLPVSGIVLSVPSKRKKVQNFFRHFHTEILRIPAFFLSPKTGVFVSRQKL